MNMEKKIDNYTFRYFYDVDVDELGHVDVEGFDVYDEDDELIAEIDFLGWDELNSMTDDEIMEMVEENRFDVRAPYH